MMDDCAGEATRINRRCSTRCAPVWIANRNRTETVIETKGEPIFLFSFLFSLSHTGREANVDGPID